MKFCFNIYVACTIFLCFRICLNLNKMNKNKGDNLLTSAESYPNTAFIDSYTENIASKIFNNISIIHKKDTHIIYSIKYITFFNIQ